MPSRPAYTSRQSTTTTSDGSCSMLSADRTTILTHSTAPTSPDIGTPTSIKKAWLPSPSNGKMMGTLMEVAENSEMDRGRAAPSKSRRGSAELERGKSVKDRVGIWETAAAVPDVPRGPTTPLRIQNKASLTPIATPGPSKARRVPVPLTEPSRKTSYRLNSPPKSTDLKRGTGSAKKMIQQWETQPGNGSPTRRTPASCVLQPTKRTYSTEYLNGKPLPVPSATPLPSSSLYATPSRPYHSPHHLATPTRQSTNLATPNTPSPRKGKGKSPLKDMLDRFGGGIKDVGRKMKGKGKDRSPGYISPAHSREDLHFWEEPKFGSNGLPGGIVFSDRMGDQEMGPNVSLDQTLADAR